MGFNESKYITGGVCKDYLQPVRPVPSVAFKENSPGVIKAET